MNGDPAEEKHKGFHELLLDLNSKNTRWSNKAKNKPVPEKNKKVLDVRSLINNVFCYGTFPESSFQQIYELSYTSVIEGIDESVAETLRTLLNIRTRSKNSTKSNRTAYQNINT